MTVKDLPCWPSEPLYDQIVDGDKLKASGADLSHYNTGGVWAEQPDPTILTAGVDFDHVVLAAASPSLPQICPKAIAALPAWKKMVDKVSWTRTQAFQLWMTRTKDEIGLPGPPAIVGSYVEPWSSITDFTHLLEREDWPASYDVKFLTYSCGVMPVTDPSDQKQADALVFDRVKGFVENNAQPIWPGTMKGNAFDWSVLAAPAGTAGVQRLAAQYWRANVDTTELYVLSTPEGIANRIAAGDDRPHQPGVRRRLDGQRLQYRQRRGRSDVGPAGGASRVRRADRHRQRRRLLIGGTPPHSYGEVSASYADGGGSSNGTAGVAGQSGEMAFRQRHVARQRETPRLVERLAHKLVLPRIDCRSMPSAVPWASRWRGRASGKERAKAPRRLTALAAIGRSPSFEEDVGEAGAAFQRVEAGRRFGGESGETVGRGLAGRRAVAAHQLRLGELARDPDALGGAYSRRAGRSRP